MSYYYNVLLAGYPIGLDCCGFEMDKKNTKEEVRDWYLNIKETLQRGYIEGTGYTLKDIKIIPKKIDIKEYLITLIKEKGIEDVFFEIEGNSGMNFMPLMVVVEHILIAPKEEQEAIKDMLIKIDFMNGNIVDYFKHLAKAIAI